MKVLLRRVAWLALLAVAAGGALWLWGLAQAVGTSPRQEALSSTRLTIGRGARCPTGR